VPLGPVHRWLVVVQDLELLGGIGVSTVLLGAVIQCLQVWNIFDEPSEGGMGKTPRPPRTDSLPVYSK
jgi:hypothetical protein